MNFFKNRKVVILVVSSVILCLGVVCLIYEKNKGEEIDNIIENSGFDGTIANNGINTENNVEKNDNAENNSSIENSDNVIYVHIIGEINTQGVLKLKKGQRIIDAIESAGGTTEIADLGKVNLAYVLSDGQQINIPSIYDDSTDFKYVTEDSGNNVITDGGSNNIEVSSKVNINTANQTELETLTGIGPSLANKIIQYRKQNGNFKSIEDLKNVSGIGESKFEAIKDSIVVK